MNMISGTDDSASNAPGMSDNNQRTSTFRKPRLSKEEKRCTTRNLSWAIQYVFDDKNLVVCDLLHRSPLNKEERPRPISDHFGFLGKRSSTRMPRKVPVGDFDFRG